MVPADCSPCGRRSEIQRAVSPSSFFEPPSVGTFDFAAREPRKSQQIHAYAANLWGLLASADVEVRDSQDDSYLKSFTFIPRREIVAAPYGHFDHRLESVGMPVELDSIEIPFVHNNSLTGFANEQDTYNPVAFGHDTPLLGPTAHPISLPPLELNELLVDQFHESEDGPELLDLSALPPLPPTPPPESALPVLRSYIPATHDDEWQEENESSLHSRPSYSIQDISPPQSPVLWPVDDDIVDVAIFLAKGHSLDCWCMFCQEPPELIDAESWINDDEWSTASTGEASQAPSVCSAWESEWGTFVDVATWEEEEWTFEGDVSDRKPSSVAHGPW